MPERPRHLRIFLASPGDVAEERRRALAVLERLPGKAFLRGKVTIEPVAWDKPGAGTPMLATLTPQEAIAQGLPRPSQCTIVVVLFWSRMGTPLPEDFATKPDGSPYLSGTEWELWDAMRHRAEGQRPEVLLYRRTEKLAFDPDEPDFDTKGEQRRRVTAFFEGLCDPNGAIHHGWNDYAGPEDFERALEDDLEKVIQRLLEGPAPDALIPDRDAAPRPLPEALRLMHDAVCGDVPPAELPPETIREIARNEPENEREWRLGRIAEWSQPRYALDRRFVQLTLMMDRGEAEAGPRWERGRERFQDLAAVLDAVDEPAVVLLGPPGSGKSTLLRRFELDRAAEALQDGRGGGPLTYFVPLNTYGPDLPRGSLPAPAAWLAAGWQRRFPALPDLQTLLRERRLVLLLDALNEMPQAGPEPIRLWKDFLLELARTWPGNRAVFSCRSLDYSAPLSTPDLRVPQVQLESLSDEQVQEFVRAYSPEQGEEIWRRLDGKPQLDLVRTPYYLKLLVEQVVATGEMPQGHAALFTGLVRQALKRELGRDSPKFQSHELLAERDRRRMASLEDWPDPHELPCRGSLFPRLARLAYRMQETGRTAEASQVRVPYDKALALVEHPQAEAILAAGEALGVLDEHLGRDEVLFAHQLLQEYFAARHLALHPAPERVATEWRSDRMPETLADLLARLADSDPLPAAPVTGWEESALLAAAMTRDPGAFVAGLMEANLPVAGRCAAQPDVPIGDPLKDRLRRALIARTEDPAADLRARIAAGRALGELGDPRFERRPGPYGEYLLPPMAEIAGGPYTIGSDEGIRDDAAPAHQVALAPYALARFPVTNAEWALFMEAGGYENEEWWDTEAGKAWRRGEGTAEGPKAQWRRDRRYIQQHLAEIREWPKQGRATSKEVEDWERYASMTDEAFEDLLERSFRGGRHTQPASWDDDAFNHPAQPVVGICWYEARAYCAWLAAQTGMPFRLPTEAEWEAAARGRAGRRYAYGEEFEAARCNTFETHVRGATPIGVFPGGETPATGLADMTGNTWDWTGSIYRPYPYRADDGREDPTSADAPRVLRGGSWIDARGGARAAVRGGYDPDGRGGRNGFRVCRSSPI